VIRRSANQTRRIFRPLGTTAAETGEARPARASWGARGTAAASTSAWPLLLGGTAVPRDSDIAGVNVNEGGQREP